MTWMKLYRRYWAWWLLILPLTIHCQLLCDDDDFLLRFHTSCFLIASFHTRWMRRSALQCRLFDLRRRRARRLMMFDTAWGYLHAAPLIDTRPLFTLMPRRIISAAFHRRGLLYELSALSHFLIFAISGFRDTHHPAHEAFISRAFSFALGRIILKICALTFSRRMTRISYMRRCDANDNFTRIFLPRLLTSALRTISQKRDCRFGQDKMRIFIYAIAFWNTLIDLSLISCRAHADARSPTADI